MHASRHRPHSRHEAVAVRYPGRCYLSHGFLYRRKTVPMGMARNGKDLATVLSGGFHVRSRELVLSLDLVQGLVRHHLARTIAAARKETTRASEAHGISATVSFTGFTKPCATYRCSRPRPSGRASQTRAAFPSCFCLPTSAVVPQPRLSRGSSPSGPLRGRPLHLSNQSG